MTLQFAYASLLLLAQATSTTTGSDAKSQPTGATQSPPALVDEVAPPAAGPKEKAKALLSQASRLYDQHEYAQALEKFTVAYDIYPSPNLLYNIGQTYQDLGRPVEALETLQRFLAVTEDDRTRGVQQQRGEARALMDSLRRKIARLHIECTIPGAEIRLDGKRLGVAPLPGPVWVAPGSHQITATMSEGFFPGLENLTVAPGEFKTATLDLKPLAAAAPPPPPEPARPTPAELAAEHARKAKLLFDAGNYSGAIAEMETQYVISADPNVLFNIGQAYRLAQRPQQAVLAYRRYLERLPQAENRQNVERLIASLEDAMRPKANPSPVQTPQQPHYPPTPGAYAQPQPGYPSQYAYYPPVDMRPTVLDYDSDKPIPPGYRLEGSARKGFVVSGAIIFGISYGIALGVAGSTTPSGSSTSASNQVPFDSSSLYIPLFGPWLALDSVQTKTCSKSSSNYQSCQDANSEANAWKAGLIIGGATQVLGFGFIVLGLSVRSHQLVLTDNVRASVLPIPMGRTGQGLALLGTFGGW